MNGYLIFKPSRSSRKQAARKGPSYHAPSSHAVTTLMGNEGVVESMSHSYPTGQSAEKDLILAAAKAERDKKIYFDKLQEALATHRSSSNSIQYFVHAAGAGTCAEIFATPTAGGTRNARPALVAYETASEFAVLNGIAASDLPGSVVGLIHDVAVHLISLFKDTSWEIDSAKTARYLANIYHDAGGLTANETEVIRALLAQKDNQYGAERANSEDELYAQAWKEVENGEMSAATWAKSFARAEGDPQKCKALYLSLRVAELRDERGR